MNAEISLAPIMYMTVTHSLSFTKMIVTQILSPSIHRSMRRRKSRIQFDLSDRAADAGSTS